MYIFVGDAVPSVPFAVGKETPEGVNTMTDVWEEYADQKVAAKVAERDKEMAISLLKEKVFNNEKIAELTKLPLAEIEALQATI